MRNATIYLFIAIAGAWLLMSCSEEKTIVPSARTMYYADVRHILDVKCATTACHAGSKPAVGLNMESYEDILAGSENGPVVVPGNAEASLLYRTMVGTSAPAMPIDDTLPRQLSDSIGSWIRDGLFESD
ncbi:MAG: hypothetical protein OEV49_06190 [candidate division Zixibacteria bacterium]|nr:hypothetical protein [candidate division Zixibacteria bacterium]MDH3936368.1 hypothetical protein [candidate division Zixibacteria bacterium]MDH4032199.1 hypothetical protein [candidate division Zixibacteria bacterium]